MDPINRRFKGKWPDKPIGKCHSEYVLGRRANKAAFEEGKPFVVSCFKTFDGRLFYSDPIRTDATAGPSTLYRIRVIPRHHRIKHAQT